MNRLTAPVLAVVGLMAACGFFPESEFTLAQDSPLPRWFEVPVGAARRDISVKMSYYLNGVTFEFRNEKTRSRLASFKGEILNDQPMYAQSIDPASPPGTIPSYSVVRVNGIIEIVEHRRRGAIFDISDDPALRAELFEQLSKTQGITGLK